MATHPELTGQLGRYRILKSLGAGGMGAVYLAEDTNLDRRVALKVPHFKPDDPSAVIERFQREARVAARIDHPNLCAVYDVGMIDGVHFFTMPYIEGTTLSHSIDATRPWNPAQAAELVRKIALAVGLLHQNGIVHRDLKPSNIMVRTSGEPVLMDFGLAHSFTSQSQRLTSTGTPLGSPSYMAPEQVTGSRDFGPPTDVYGLGMILFEMVTGHLPFEGPMMALFGQILHTPPRPPSAFHPALDARMDAICLKALGKKPEDRHPTMELFAAELATYATQRPAPVAPPPLAPTLATREPGRAAPTPEPVVRGATLIGHDDQEPPLAEIICPQCSKTLKVPMTMTGRKVKCPRCQTALGRIGEPAPPASDQASRNTSPQARDETAGYGAPRPRVVQPASRPGGQGTRRRDHAEDAYAFVEPLDEDAPLTRRRGGKPRGRNPRWAWVVLAILFLLGGASGLYYYFRGGPGVHFEYVPRSSHAFVTLNISEAVRTDVGKKVLEKMHAGSGGLTEFEQKTGIALDDIERVTAVIAEDGTEWTVLTTRRAYDRKKVLEYFDNPAETTHQGKPYYRDANRFAVHFADAKTLVMGGDRELTRCLELTQPASGGPLQEGVELALKSKSLGVAAVNVAELQKRAVPVAEVQAPMDEPQPGKDLGLLRNPYEGVKAAFATLSGTDRIEAAVAVEFVDAQKAADVLKEIPGAIESLRSLFEMAKPGLKDAKRSGMDTRLFVNITLGLLDQFKPQQTGARLTCTLSVDSRDLVTLIDSMSAEELGGNVVSGSRGKAMNNMKQLGMALHAYHDSTQKIDLALHDPVNPFGPPLLSWRVAILPYIEQQDLYNQIRLNEPWNSPHNSQFHNRMPKIFQLPGTDAVSTSQTAIQMLTGTGTLWPQGTTTIRIPANFPDGTSNTVLLIEGSKPVNWMEPADLAYTQLNPRTGMGNRYGKGPLVLMGDGSVRFIAPAISTETLRNAINPSDNMALGADWDEK